jgi:hypothetical protein
MAPGYKYCWCIAADLVGDRSVALGCEESAATQKPSIMPPAGWLLAVVCMWRVAQNTVDLPNLVCKHRYSNGRRQLPPSRAARLMKAQTPMKNGWKLTADPEGFQSNSLGDPSGHDSEGTSTSLQIGVNYER